MMRSYFYKALSLACVAGLAATLLVMSEESTPMPSETPIPGSVIPREPMEVQIGGKYDRTETVTVLRHVVKANKHGGFDPNLFMVRDSKGQEKEMSIHSNNCKDHKKVLEHFRHPGMEGYYIPLEMTLTIHNRVKKEKPVTKTGKVLATNPSLGFWFQENSTGIKERIPFHAIPMENRITILKTLPTIPRTNDEIRKLAESHDHSAEAQIKANMTTAEHLANHREKEEAFLREFGQSSQASLYEFIAHAKKGTFKTIKEAIPMLKDPTIFPETDRHEKNERLYRSATSYPQYHDDSVDPVDWRDVIQSMEPKDANETEIVSLRPTFEKMGIRPIQQTPKGCALYSGYYLANYLIQKEGGRPLSFGTYEKAVVDAEQKITGRRKNPKTESFSHKSVTGGIKTLRSGKKLKTMRIPRENRMVGGQSLQPEIVKHFLRNGIPVPTIVNGGVGIGMTRHSTLIVGFRQEKGKCTFECIETYGTKKFHGGYREINGPWNAWVVWTE